MGTQNKGMAAARAAISAKCASLTEYFVTRYLAEQTARSVAFLAEQNDVLGSGAVIQYVSRSVVTTAMVISPIVFYDQREGRCEWRRSATAPFRSTTKALGTRRRST